MSVRVEYMDAAHTSFGSHTSVNEDESVVTELEPGEVGVSIAADEVTVIYGTPAQLQECVSRFAEAVRAAIAEEAGRG